MTQDNTSNVENKSYQDELQVMGEQLLSKVKELVHEGTVRRIIIKDQNGHTILEIPLTIGVVGAILAPALAAVGTVGALLAQCSIQVVRTETPSTPDEPPLG
jgi:Domain of unknown function (DUF4342)